MIMKENLPDWFVPGVNVITTGDSVCHGIPRETFLTLGVWHESGLYLHSQHKRKTWVSYRDVVPVASKTLEELL